MEKHPSGKPVPLRIAVVWPSLSLQAQRVLSAVYRAAGFVPGLTLRLFERSPVNWQRDVARPMRDWQPHGVLARASDSRLLARLRKILPDIPLVTTTVTAPGLATSNVVVDMAEAIAISLEHFRSRGIPNVALFHSTEPAYAATRVEPFLAAAPGSPVYGTDLKQPEGPDGWPVGERERIAAWLHSLPKPVGLLSLENHAAWMLMRLCQDIGGRVPEDVQLIGVDDLDQCLSCEPHLTSLDLPSERIGEVALETLLAHLRGNQPPPPVIRVSGCSLIARGSTGLAAVGSGKIASAVRTIQANAAKGLSAARIVKQARVGQTTFYKQFRARTGTTPARQLRETRLKKACQMLAETDTGIAEIATACGLSGGNYFARFFRHATGQTPSEYREMNRGV